MQDIPFHGEFSSADASALAESASRFTLYEYGTNEAITLQATDIVAVEGIIYDYTGAAARTFYTYDGADNTVGAGEKMCETTLAQNQHSESHAHEPFFCQPGTYPKVKASGAGQITVLIRGYVSRYT